MPADLPSGVLASEAVRLGQSASDKLDALRQSGAVLTDLGAVEPGYVDAMLAREEMVSTFMGEGVAIPHGTNEARELVHRTALGFLQFPDGVHWGEDDQIVKVCIPIAAAGGEHMALLSALATVLVDPDKAEALRSAASADEVLDILASAADDDADDAAADADSQAVTTEGVSS